jgi:hypothetical protein
MMVSRTEFWIAATIIFLVLWNTHNHIHEVACKVGADRICQSHWW